MRYVFLTLFFVLVAVNSAFAAGADALVSRLVAEQELSKEEAKRQVQHVFEAIAAELGEGREVGIRNFGTFYLNQRDARTARNPRTGEPVEVPARAYPKFRSSKNLKSSVNNS